MGLSRFRYVLARQHFGGLGWAWALFLETPQGEAIVEMYYLDDRAPAIQRASRKLNALSGWQRSELRIRRRDGKYAQETRTYPRSTDPRGSKG